MISIQPDPNTESEIIEWTASPCTCLLAHNEISTPGRRIMGIRIGKTNRIIGLIAALVALLVISATSSPGAWDGSRVHSPGAAQSPPPYPQAEPPAGFQS